MLKLYLWIRNMLEGEEGQDLAEYALILVLIAIAAIATMGLLGDQINNIFQEVSNELSLPVG